MSEADHQDTNGTANGGGDVPEIELIIKEEYILQDEALEDELDSKIDSEEEEFQKVQNECLAKIKEEKNNDSTDRDVENDDDTCYSTIYCESIKRSASTTSSSAIEYAIAVAEACDGVDSTEYQIAECDDVPKPKKSKYINAKENVKVRPSVDEENMQKAIDAVLFEGLSIAKAAKMYKVVNTTLWLRIRKQPIRPKRSRQYREIVDAAICDNLSTGASLSATARQFKVSKATICRRKQKFVETGALENDSLMKSSIQERFSQAYRAYRVNGMSIRFAAKFFSLPPASLWRYIKRNEAQKSTETEEEDITETENDESSSRLEDCIEEDTILKDVDWNKEFNVQDQLVFDIEESRDNGENTTGLENLKTESPYNELEDQMIFEDERLIRILK